MNSDLRRKNLLWTGRTPPSVRSRLDAACAEIEQRGKVSRQPAAWARGSVPTLKPWMSLQGREIYL
jgi:hypothetical protein